MGEADVPELNKLDPTPWTHGPYAYQKVTYTVFDMVLRSECDSLGPMGSFRAKFRANSSYIFLNIWGKPTGQTA